jgi:hypothetical protein
MSQLTARDLSVYSHVAISKHVKASAKALIMRWNAILQPTASRAYYVPIDAKVKGITPHNIRHRRLFVAAVKQSNDEDFLAYENLVGLCKFC